jgi:long-chain acyl-CoA synthetase
MTPVGQTFVRLASGIRTERGRSRRSDALCLREGGEGFETKAVEGRLWIRGESVIFGYLNGPSSFDANGCFGPGVLVDVDGG